MPIPSRYNRLMPYRIIPKTSAFFGFMKDVFGATDQFAAGPAGIFKYVEDLDETYKKALEASAVSTMEPTQQLYGHTWRFHDPFGNDWWPAEGNESYLKSQILK